MKALSILSVLAVFGGLTLACAEDDTNTLSNEEPTIAAKGDPKKDTDKTEPKPATSSSAQSSNASTPPKTDAGAPAANACVPGQQKNQTECMKCCATKAGAEPAKQANSCACGATAKCKDACANSVCGANPGLPDIACGICLLGANCDLGDLAGAATGAAQGGGECARQCGDLPNN